MNLDDWMNKNAVSSEDLGKTIGFTGQAVRRYRTGERMPDAETSHKIWLATSGLVTVQDLHETRLAFVRSAPKPTEAGEAA